MTSRLGQQEDMHHPQGFSFWMLALETEPAKTQHLTPNKWVKEHLDDTRFQPSSLPAKTSDTVEHRHVGLIMPSPNY